MNRAELEARLRSHAKGFDAEVGHRPDLEQRILAQAVATPAAPVRRVPLVRELAVAAAVLLVAGALGFGVFQLRAFRQSTAQHAVPTLGPRLSYTPGIAVPPGPIELGSNRTGTTIKMFTALRGWALGPPTGKLGTGVHDALLVTADGGSHWRNVSPPGSADLNRIHAFLDVNHAWVVVTPGPASGLGPQPAPAVITVFRTADGGASWRRATLPVPDGLPSELDFVDPMHGWLVLSTDNGITFYRTSDGGARWTLASVQHRLQAPGSTYPPGTLPLGVPPATLAGTDPSCSFEASAGLTLQDPSTGWASGSCSGPEATTYLYVTNDAGRTWNAQSLPAFPLSTKCPCSVTSTAPTFTSPRDASFAVYISSTTTVCESTPTGTGCSTEGTPTHVFLAITSDGGATWSWRVLPGVTGFGGEPMMVDGHTGWFTAAVLKPNGALPADTVFDKLYVTHDGGGTWMPVPTPSIFEGGTLDFVDGTTGWALNGVAPGLQTLLKTTDGGRSWKQLNVVLDR